MKAGDKVFVPPEHIGSTGRTYEVARVGRTWATMKETWAPRVNLGTMRTDGNRSTRVYESEAAWNIEREQSNSWSKLVSDLRYISYCRPNHIGHEQIAEIRSLIWQEELER